MPTKPSIAFYTFGCRLNQSETAVVERTFEADGFTIVDIQEPADVVVVNTCTVTENGDNDTRRLVNRINRINPDAQIALIGCQAQIQKARLAALPNVRWVIGNAQKTDFLAILKKDARPASTVVITPAIPRESFTVPVAGIDRKHTRANIKIQDGCDFFCSFCEIPYARGRARSRDFTDIIREARILAGSGHRELILTGINLGTYLNNGKSLFEVIEELEQITGLERIRISSIEPTTVDPRLINKMGGTTKLCRHLHIPLQSAAGAVLTQMKRKYTLEQFNRFITDVYKAVPGVCLGTDIIVGFPGEADEHFQETARYLRESVINYCHVFSYSQRHLAKSQSFGGQLSPEVIARRSRILREISARKRELFHQTLLGTKMKVLFEQKKNKMWSGLTDNYARVTVRADTNLSNTLCSVHLKQANGACISGTLNGEPND